MTTELQQRADGWVRASDLVSLLRRWQRRAETWERAAADDGLDAAEVARLKARANDVWDCWIELDELMTKQANDPSSATARTTHGNMVGTEPSATSHGGAYVVVAGTPSTYTDWDLNTPTWIEPEPDLESIRQEPVLHRTYLSQLKPSIPKTPHRDHRSDPRWSARRWKAKT